MSKSKKKTHSEIEHLRGQVKKLKSENKQLKRRLKNFEKRPVVDLEDLVHDVEIIEEMNQCPSCEKGILEIHDFVHVKLEKCNQCEYSKKLGKNGKEDTQEET